MIEKYKNKLKQAEDDYFNNTDPSLDSVYRDRVNFITQVIDDIRTLENELSYLKDNLY